MALGVMIAPDIKARLNMALFNKMSSLNYYFKLTNLMS